MKMFICAVGRALSLPDQSDINIHPDIDIHMYETQYVHSRRLPEECLETVFLPGVFI